MTDLSKLNSGELKALIEQATKELKSREKSEVEAARNEIYAIAHRLGLPLKSLIGPGTTPKKAIGKVAVQYRNPADESQEWTGRGRQPKWVKQYVDGGGNLLELKIK